VKVKQALVLWIKASLERPLTMSSTNKSSILKAVKQLWLGFVRVTGKECDFNSE
jgi:hypothetical protein